MPTIKHNEGFTLIEALVYIGLFSLIMFGALVGAMQIIDANVSTRTRVVTEQEAHFIFRKVDWATNGNVDNVTTISDGFRIVKGGSNIDFVLDGGALELDGDPLTSSAITVSNLFVEITPASPPVPKALSISFALNDRWFATSTRYVR